MSAVILVADDDASFLALVALALARAGHTVLRADDGAAALAIAERDRPDLVVADVTMPGLTGVELAMRLREGADGPGPPVLLISGGPPPALPERATFLAKPFDVGRLLRAVEGLLPAPRLVAAPPPAR